jgi:integral membrane protein (TIGR01906 family)
VPLKISGKIARWIFILCLPALLLSASLAWGFNSLWLYKYGFQKYNVSQTTGLTGAQLDQAARGLIDYFKINSPDEYIQVTLVENGQNFNLFNEEEQLHFKDVRGLIYLDYRVFLLTLIFCLGYISVAIFWRRRKYWRPLAVSVLWGSGISLGLILIIGIASFFDFNQLFLQFHYLVFSNQYWSAAGYMLLLFPGDFWYDAALICFAFMASVALLLGIIAFLYLKLSKPDYSHS